MVEINPRSDIVEQKMEPKIPSVYLPLYAFLYQTFEDSQGDKTIQTDIFTLVHLNNNLPVLPFDGPNVPIDFINNFPMPKSHIKNISNVNDTVLDMMHVLLEEYDFNPNPGFKLLAPENVAKNIFHNLLARELYYQLFGRQGRHLGKSFRSDPYCSHLREYALQEMQTEISDMQSVYDLAKESFLNIQDNICHTTPQIEKINTILSKLTTKDYSDGGLNFDIIYSFLESRLGGNLDRRDYVNALLVCIVQLWEKNHPGRNFFEK